MSPTDEEKKLQKKREEFKKTLVPGYKLNSYPNRASRRKAAKSAGYIKDGWSMYRAPEGSNVQTEVKEA